MGFFDDVILGSNWDEDGNLTVLWNLKMLFQNEPLILNFSEFLKQVQKFFRG